MNNAASPAALAPATKQVACAACALKPFCVARSAQSEGGAVDRRRLHAGQVLYAQGEPPAALYAVRAGFFKSCLASGPGEPRVVGFHIMGDVLGLDSMGAASHRSSAIALGDAEVCLLPLPNAERAMDDRAAIAADIRALMGEQLAAASERMVALCATSARSRVASHLLEVTRRWAGRGYSPREFELCMSRKDIGSYLGLTFESVSRTLSRFAANGWIALSGRKVKILDPTALQAQLTRD